jgi:hypothetical protein
LPHRRLAPLRVAQVPLTNHVTPDPRTVHNDDQAHKHRLRS